jgi:hypothetical protein
MQRGDSQGRPAASVRFFQVTLTLAPRRPLGESTPRREPRRARLALGRYPPRLLMTTSVRDEVDVCVVGSGAGGGPLAFALARAGARVVVLEKGPWDRKEDFDHDEIDTIRLDKWVPSIADEPHLLQLAGDAAPRKATQDGSPTASAAGRCTGADSCTACIPTTFASRPATARRRCDSRRLADRLRRLRPTTTRSSARSGSPESRGAPVRPAALGPVSAAAAPDANPLRH